MRKRLWQLHSLSGLFAGLGLLIIGLSGSVLVFSYEVDSLFHPQLVHVQPQPTRLPYDVLLPRVQAQLPGWEITRWIVRPDPAAADVVRVCPAGGSADLRAYANPYTGEVLGRREWRETVCGWLLILHESLFLSNWGTLLAGIMAVLLLFAGLSGVWLYREFWKHFMRLRWKASARIFFSDLHKTVGITSVGFNLILGFTGAWWNLQILPELWHPEPPTLRVRERLFSEQISLDGMVAQAPRSFPGLDLHEMSIEFPFQAGEPFQVVGRGPGSNPLRSIWGSNVSFDAQTGAVVKITDLRQQSLWERIRDTFGPLHFGTFGGLPIKIIWCLGGLTPGILAVSGFLIWRSRRKKTSHYFCG